MAKDIKYLKERYQQMRTRKLLRREDLEEINRYVRQEGFLFEESVESSNLDDEDDRIYESTAPNASRKLASILKGILWPAAKGSFELRRHPLISDTKENNDFYEMMTTKTVDTMDNPKGGLPNAIEEDFYEQVTLGSAGLFIAEDEKTKVRFSTWGLKNISFAEGENGIVNTVYVDDHWTIKRLVETYGIENVSPQVKKFFETNKLNEKVKIIQAIEPKIKKNKKESYLFESIHFEYDTGQILKESKFYEFPMPVARFYKNTDNEYGISPAMESRPAIKEINRKVQLREYLEEQEVQPALGFIATAFGGEYLDISPNALNPFNELLTSNTPVFRIIPQVNLNISDESIVRLDNKITEAFSLDRLLDFNNETAMTLGEAQIRQQIRGQVNNSIFSRQNSELFTPLIERTVNILFRQGEFGVIKGSDEEKIRIREGKEITYIPDEIAKLIKEGKEFYQIVYTTPAARMKSAEELNGMVQAVTYITQLAQAKPDVLMHLDDRAILENAQKLTGSPRILLAKDEVEELQKQKQEAQKRQQEQVEASNQLTLEKQAREA